jgi:hypothetical protein
MLLHLVLQLLSYLMLQLISHLGGPRLLSR